MTVPSVGRIVHFFVPDVKRNNGGEIAPAMITRVLKEHCVNLRVFYDDSDETGVFTNVRLFNDVQDAISTYNAVLASLPPEQQDGLWRPFGCFWPPHVA